METKKCSRCEQEKPVSEYYSTLVRGKRKIQSWCKECAKAHQRKRYEQGEYLKDAEAHERKKEYLREYGAAHKEEAAERYKQWYRKRRTADPKLCKWCGKPLPPDTRARYCSDDCRRQGRNQAYRKYAAGKRKAGPRRARRSPNRNDDGTTTCLHCGETKPGTEFYQYRTVCKVCQKQYKDQWLTTKDKHYLREFARRRRLRLRGAPGHHTWRQWESLKRKYNYTCLCCGRREPEVELTRDHIVPLLHGGSDDINNIQPLCRSCNSSKHATTVDFRE